MLSVRLCDNQGMNLGSNKPAITAAKLTLFIQYDKESLPATRQ